MAILPKELLDVAQRLFVDNKTDEKYIRTTIGRAYYCAYHSCLPISKALPKVDYLPGHPPGSHQEVIDRLVLCPHGSMNEAYTKYMRIIGRGLQAAFDDRIKADYHLDQTCTSHEGNQQLIRVSRLLRELEAAARLKTA